MPVGRCTPPWVRLNRPTLPTWTQSFNYPQSYYSYLGLVELVNAGYPVDELQRGLVDYYAGQYGVALAAFDRYLSTSPSDPSTALYYKGLILRDQDDLPGAIALWDEIIQGDQTSSFWILPGSKKLTRNGHIKEITLQGEKTLLDFVAAFPTHPRAPSFSSMLVVSLNVMIAWPMLPRSGCAFRLNTRTPNMFTVPYSWLVSANIDWKITLLHNIFWQAQSIATTPTRACWGIFSG